MTGAPRGHRLLMAAAVIVATAAGIVGATMLDTLPDYSVWLRPPA